MAKLSETVPTNTLTLPSRGIAAGELRPWGSFTVLEEGRGYKIKRIEV
ncbi:MAG: mannose-6-phosphate isomerase, partial [Dolichospermum sp.]